MKDNLNLKECVQYAKIVENEIYVLLKCPTYSADSNLLLEKGSYVKYKF
jgi:hypothetical protein